jgi:hypothetical protein
LPQCLLSDIGRCNSTSGRSDRSNLANPCTRCRHGLQLSRNGAIDGAEVEEDMSRTATEINVERSDSKVRTTRNRRGILVTYFNTYVVCHTFKTLKMSFYVSILDVDDSFQRNFVRGCRRE